MELQAFRDGVSEAEAKLNRLSQKLSEIESQKEEDNAAIDRAEERIHITTESTSSEVLRLKGRSQMLYRRQSD